MKETPLATCEKEFITRAIKSNQRLDGRKNDEFRNITINYGHDVGSVLVSLGETRVLAEVSASLGPPKANRPTEGVLYINVELGPMAAPHFEAGRNSELTVQINRTLERAFIDSRCLDLESLCITADERVWTLKVGLNALNHEGNLIDCCSIAALCALAHFQRPDVSIIEDEVHIHKPEEKELIPMVLHHYPVCISYCTFNDGLIAVADPTAIEERTAESTLVFGINSYRELCCLNVGGKTLTSTQLLLQCANRAALRSKWLVDFVKRSLTQDAEQRQNGVKVSFTECLRSNKITSYSESRLTFKLRDFNIKELNNDIHSEEEHENNEGKQRDSDENPKSSDQNVDKVNSDEPSTISSPVWIPNEDENIHLDFEPVQSEEGN